MRQFLKRDFCLWVVPPESGKVKKFRFSVRFLLVVGMIVGFMALSYVYVSSDYARVQFIRIQNYITLTRLKSERDTLANENEAVAGELQNLRDVNAEADKREKAVRERLDELASVIKSVPALEDTNRDLAARVDEKSKGRQKAIGGAELDCIKKNGAACPVFGLEKFRIGGISLPLVSRYPGQDSPANLIEALDHYVEVVKMLPAGTPSGAEINSLFGYRHSPFGQGIKLHEGIDFALSIGDPVIATGDGVVTSVGWDYRYGILVDIAHSSRITTRYAHLSKAMVQVGQRVCRGKVIGLGGSTGRSTGPHLHYEVRVDGEAKNPAPFVELAAKISKVVAG